MLLNQKKGEKYISNTFKYIHQDQEVSEIIGIINNFEMFNDDFTIIL